MHMKPFEKTRDTGALASRGFITALLAEETLADIGVAKTVDDVLTPKNGCEQSHVVAV